VRKAALQYNIPVQTLRDRIQGKVDPENYGNETIFSPEEELAMVANAEQYARLGFGYSNTALQRTAGELAYEMGRRSTDKPLSNCWLYGFLRRWGDRIKSIKPASLDSHRAKHTTPESVAEYFNNLEEAFMKYSLVDRPDLIYNLDETGISPEHRPPNVIAPVEGKTHSVTSPRSANTTVIACVNAAGNHLPPYFIFKGTNVYYIHIITTTELLQNINQTKRI
jgi:hypothetical protein